MQPELKQQNSPLEKNCKWSKLIEALPTQIQNKVQQFTEQEDSMGVNLKNFKQKFVFDYNSGTNSEEAIYFSIDKLLPSQNDGLSREQDDICSYLLSEILYKAGEMLQIPLTTTIVAISMAQYFYIRNSYLKYDFRDIAMGAMFLACKSQETLRKSYQITSVFDYLFKVNFSLISSTQTLEGIKNVKVLKIDSTEFTHMKSQTLKAENQILFTLGFEVYKLFDIPHRYISGLLASFNRHKRCNEIVQTSWTYLNDIYKTKAVCYFSGQTIAASAILMALKKLQIPFAEKPWWILMETSLEMIMHIVSIMEYFYSTIGKENVDFESVSKFLEQKSVKNLNVKNCFPVPYSRKVRLFNENNLQKSLIEEVPLERVQQERDRSRQKLSNIEQQPQAHEKAIRVTYVNDDQTPKVKRDRLYDKKEAEQKPQVLEEKKPTTKQLDTKSMLSKISSKLKNLSEKKDVDISLNTNNPGVEAPNFQQKKESESEDQDELLADLIKIKKNNLKKKDEREN